MLSRSQARAYYDRMGARQDLSRFFEDPPTRHLTEHLALADARHVVEFGCGTGRFAAGLLRTHLPETARYTALDQSATMIALAGEKLAPFGDRARVVRTDGTPALPLPDACADRFISNYVLDLLSVEDIAALLAEAHRVVGPGGLLGVASLGWGESRPSRWVARTWAAIHRRRAFWVGGCRPLALRDHLDPARWKVCDARTLAPWGLPSEVVIAERLA